MRLVLFQPDIPQNTGTLFRLGACLGVPVDVIEPCGFLLDDKKLRRAAMDYYDALTLTRHVSWAAYDAHRKTAGARLILLTVQGSVPCTEAAFRPQDHIMVGRESAGVPDIVHESADLRVRIPMQAGMRSLNVAISAAMVLGEALRQVKGSGSGLING